MRTHTNTKQLTRNAAALAQLESQYTAKSTSTRVQWPYMAWLHLMK